MDVGAGLNVLLYNMLLHGHHCMDTAAWGTAVNVGTLWVSALTLGSEVGTAGKKGLFLGKGLSPHWEDGTLDSSRLAGDEREQFLM